MNTFFERKFIFITGAPRSGTSMLTKAVDAHPDIAILMENNFLNLRRHWKKKESWHSVETLREDVERVYSHLKEPILGNKICTPDVWGADDINMFCRLFRDPRIIFIVRDPVAVSLSRYKRETGIHDYATIYNDDGRLNSLLNFKSQYHTYVSSWRQMIENYWRLKDGFGEERIKLVYYEDLCTDFETQMKEIMAFFEVEFHMRILNWYQYPHYNSVGKLDRDLKYKDEATFVNNTNTECPEALAERLKSIEYHYNLWKKRELHLL